jgi:hypothetical protein
MLRHPSSAVRPRFIYTLLHLHVRYYNITGCAYVLMSSTYIYHRMYVRTYVNHPLERLMGGGGYLLTRVKRNNYQKIAYCKKQALI